MPALFFSEFTQKSTVNSYHEMSAAVLQLIFLFKEGREGRDGKSRARKPSSRPWPYGQSLMESINHRLYGSDLVLPKLQRVPEQLRHIAVVFLRTRRVRLIIANPKGEANNRIRRKKCRRFFMIFKFDICVLVDVTE